MTLTEARDALERAAVEFGDAANAARAEYGMKDSPALKEMQKKMWPVLDAADAFARAKREA